MPEVVRRKADFSELRLFWAVAEAGSFGAAARALGVSASTLTRALDNLEARLGAKLVVRSPQGVSLTPAGETAYDRVLTMERAAAALEMELAGHDRSAQGLVKLSCPDGIGGVFLTPWLPDFMRAHPDIELAVDCGLWPDRPLEGEVDVALTFSKPEQDEVIAQPLAHFHYAPFVARGYIDLYGMPRTLQEALNHPYVHHAGQVHQRDEKGAAYQAMSRQRLRTNSSAVSFNAIREGAGIGGLPTAILAIDPTLVMLEGLVMGPVTLWMAKRREIAKSARVRQVVEWLEEVFDQKTQPWYREEYIAPADFAPELARFLERRRGAAAVAPPPAETARTA
ncbi:MAG TPA: LysR family transcriptional regulator [Caulobacteraceae bacterium]